ncbi:MAG: IS982 family transposase, partial [Hymenobacter sp.]|nr:IS982 family transposase [Hymenobacter sp.]
MTEQTVAMYCFIDDLLTHCRPAWAPQPDPRQRLSHAQVLTTALIAARYFGGN